MEYFYLILIVCIAGCGYTSYKAGVREGATRMLEALESHSKNPNGIVRIKFDGDKVEFL
jgi:uncharacterized lipoprotein YehR (DUF1307 family)